MFEFFVCGECGEPATFHFGTESDGDTIVCTVNSRHVRKGTQDDAVKLLQDAGQELIQAGKDLDENSIRKKWLQGVETYGVFTDGVTVGESE